MKKFEIIWNELKCAERGYNFACPLIFLDPQMPIPWDLQNSAIYRMQTYIKNHPEAAKQRFNVFFGAYIPQIDYKTNLQMIPVIEHIADWIYEYPEQIIICDR